MTINQPTLQDANPSKKVKHPTAQKIKFYCHPHCSHLPLLADTQASPKAKSKESNRQRLTKPDNFG